MARVLTNTTALAIVRETALGVAGTSGWDQLEFDNPSAFGATVDTVARNPISRKRQRRAGTITDVNSSVEFETDLTMALVNTLGEAALYVTGINTDVTNIPVTAAETTGDSYTVSALTAAQAVKFDVGTLVWVAGAANSGNNGLKEVDADIATSATAISVVENLTDESSVTFYLSLAGYRIQAADSPTWTWDAGNATGTLAGVTGVGTAVAALGAIPGMHVHIGSIASAGASVTNAFENSSANDMYGYARIKTINADSIVFDKVADELKFTDGTAPANDVDIVFGQFLRNVATDSAEFLEVSHTVEATFTDLDSVGTDEYEYAHGNYVNTFAMNVPLTEKATVTVNMFGTDATPPSTTRLTGASSAAEPNGTEAYNTSLDAARFRVQNVDDTGLTTDITSATITINNNVSGEKVIGFAGSKYINYGNVDVDVELQAVFSNGDVISAVRNNTTVTADFIMANNDGVVVIDIPSMKLGGGDREFPENASVLVNLTGQAFEDATLGTSIGISIMPVPLP